MAIVLANSPARGAYEALWSAAVDVRLGPLAVRDNVRHLINDGLMALFFFVVGLEIKRELRCGELAGRYAAALVGLAAARGADAAGAALHRDPRRRAGRRGVGDPHGHRHRFAIGVLALLGDRVYSRKGLFLLAIAVVDDIIAIAVIALFYSNAITVGCCSARSEGSRSASRCEGSA